MSDFFDDIEDGIADSSLSIDPFYKAVEKNEKDLLAWLNNISGTLLKDSQHRTMGQRKNLAFYRGLDTRNVSRRDFDEGSRSRRFSSNQRFIVNHLYDLTETKISQMTKLKPAVEILPTNDEWSDRASAKVVDLMVKHLWYINNIDFLVQQMHRHARIFGESYAFTLWDKSKGDLLPAWVEARDAGLESITLPDGREFKIDEEQPLKTGDICYDIEVPWRVLIQKRKHIDESEYCFRIKTEMVDKLKDEYPDKKEDINSTDRLRVYDFEFMEDKILENHVVVYEFYHKRTKEVGKGAYIRFTEDTILEQGDYIFTNDTLPFVRLTDLDVPEVLHGVSRYETIIPMQQMYNNLSSLIAKNIYLTAHAKWMMPRGACKIDQLGNDNTIVQFQGPVAPQLVTAPSNPPEVFAFRQNVKEEMQVIYGSHGISRGEVPKGITASSALQFLNELENDRASTDIAKHSFLIKALAKQTIAITGDKYEVDDGRMVRIVGENNKFLIRNFDLSNLNKSYDVRVDNSTGLPESKAGRTQRILDAMQRNPDMLSPERWEELLELGNTEKLENLTTEAIKSADSENEDMLAGREIANVDEFEDHIQHWNSHVKSMQARSFKEDAPSEVIAAMKDHVFWHEEAMMEKAKTNPEFQAEIARLTLFPIFYHSDAIVPQSLEQQQAVVQGQANKGEEVTGMIPGTPAESEEA